MNHPELEKLKYPIGVFNKPEIINQEHLSTWIEEIQKFPFSIYELTRNLDQEQLNWRYRPRGWNIKQLTHHCADSHLNAFIRCKLTLTEDKPTVRPYFEDRWAELTDSLDDDIEDTLILTKGLHSRWAKLLKSLSEAELRREYLHPEHGQKFNLKETIGIYAWHCRHHLAHVRQALTFQGGFE